MAPECQAYPLLEQNFPGLTKSECIDINRINFALGVKRIPLYFAIAKTARVSTILFFLFVFESCSHLVLPTCRRCRPGRARLCSSLREEDPRSPARKIPLPPTSSTHYRPFELRRQGPRDQAVRLTYFYAFRMRVCFLLVEWSDRCVPLPTRRSRSKNQTLLDAMACTPHLGRSEVLVKVTYRSPAPKLA